MLITSRNNATVKKIRALHNRKERERSGLFYAEGIRIVAEAVAAGTAIDSIVVAPNLLTSDFAKQLVQEQQQHGVPCVEVADDVFQSFSLKDHPQGLGLVANQNWTAADDVRLDADAFWTVLSGVQDPGNLGAILRTCDAVGCTGVILLGNTTDPFSPAAVRASMGALFRQRVVRADLAQLTHWKERFHCQVVGTSDSAAADYQAVSYGKPLLLFMGSEQHGLSPEEQALCDSIVRIPMVGSSDSLNLSIATAVVLYEIFNQFRASENG